MKLLKNTTQSAFLEETYFLHVSGNSPLRQYATFVTSMNIASFQGLVLITIPVVLISKFPSTSNLPNFDDLQSTCCFQIFSIKSTLKTSSKSG